MPRSNEPLVRRQIAEAFRQASQQIDQEVARALADTGRFEYKFDAEGLRVVFANIFHTLVELQRFAGLTVPLTHNVAVMEIQIEYPRVSVSSILHIHSPIKAFISVEYMLINHPALEGALALSRQSVSVHEKTARFDLMARAALAAIDIEGLIERELQDPAGVIRQTLPHRLRSYGFDGQIGLVRLEVTPDNQLHAILTNHAHPAD